MAATADQAFWALVVYIRNNRFKGPGGLTVDDLNNMVAKFQAANTTEITSSTDPGTYGDIEWPDQDGAGTVAATTASVAQAWYPEQHPGH
jgi:hypothetical protein